VSKPDRKDVQGNTVVVVVACIVLGIFLWLVDGSTGSPQWVSIHGFAILVGILVAAPLIAKRYTPQWKLAIPIAALPLVVVLLSVLVFKQESFTGFGLALLRSWFIRG